jgi:hypothetical protein
MSEGSHTICVRYTSRRASRRPRRAACEHRSRRWSPMPTPERSRIVICAGSHLSWRSRDSAMPLGLTLRRWNEAAGWPAGGGRADESSQARSPTTKCQTNLVFAVTPASFLAQPAERRKAGRCHGYCCASWPGEASRPFFLRVCRDIRARSARTGV